MRRIPIETAKKLFILARYEEESAARYAVSVERKEATSDAANTARTAIDVPRYQRWISIVSGTDVSSKYQKKANAQVRRP